jgi:hypothetical protein
MSMLPALVYNRGMVVHENCPSHHYEHDDFHREPPIETVIDSDDIKEKVMDYLGAVLARCWYDKKLMAGLELNAHRTLRHLGILLPPELEIKFEKTNKERPKLLIYEWNKERTFKRKVCHLQMIMMAGR